MYEFTKDCMINIKEIDDEHSKLFQMINEAVDMNNKLDDITGVSKSLIANLKEYAATHFAHEEAYMESINDPELPLQKKEHAAFVERLVEIDFKDLDNMDDNQQEYLLELIQFLVSWLSNHILGEDKKIGDFVVKQGITVE